MSFATAVRTCLSKYVDFSGRARRSEYWYFFLFFMIVSFVAGFIDGLLGMTTFAGFGILSIVVLLALLLPSLAVAVRRLHDTDRTGWWLLLGFIPFAGLVLLVFYCLDSKPGDNQYGPNPKDPHAAGAYPPPPAPYGGGQYSS